MKLKTYPSKFLRTNFEIENWNNRGDYEIRWNIVSPKGIPLRIEGIHIDNLLDGETKIIHVSSFYYQFGSPCTTYQCSDCEPTPYKSSSGEVTYHGTFLVTRKGYKLIVTNIDCVI